MKGRAPRRWASIELLLEDDMETPIGYVGTPGGRVEPVPNGHETMKAGRWRDGDRVIAVAPEGIGSVSSGAAPRVPPTRAREKNPPTVALKGPWRAKGSRKEPR